jgi:phosphoserine/homoserine phosphotransferase
MYIVCSDLEGVLVPEIWINVAEKTGIEELRLTTRDISDYDVLMKKRLAILDEKKLTMEDITRVIKTMEPFEGAVELLDWIRSVAQLVILSDTYTEFAGPLMKKLGWPTLFCNSLTIGPDGSIAGYHLRQEDGKCRAVLSFRDLNYQTIAVGDSYNDITMIKEADVGILFRPPANVESEFSELPVARNYDDLKNLIQRTIFQEK